MKKLIIILSFLISSVFAYSQGVKISAMPTWTTSLDSVWFPIIDHSTSTWINYRAQGYQIGKERIDSIVNNWPSGGGTITASRGLHMQESDVRWGGLLDSTVIISQAANPIFFQGGAFEHDDGDYINVATYYASFSNDAISGFSYWGGDGAGNDYQLNSRSLVTGGYIASGTFSAEGDSRIIQEGDRVEIWSETGELYIPDLDDSVQSYVLYYDPTLEKVTYHTAPSGGGGAAGAVYGENGLSNRNDSTIILGGTADQNTTITWANFVFTNTWNTLSGTGLKLSSTSTAAASNLQMLLEIDLSGANATSLQNTYGAHIQNFHTGTTSTNYGLYAAAGSGTLQNFGVYGVANDANGFGVRGNSTSGIGVYGVSTSGVGAQGISSSSTGLIGVSTTGIAISGFVTPTSTNTTAQVMSLSRRTSGTAANSIAGYVSLDAATVSNSTPGSSVARIEWIWTDATDASRTGDLDFWTTNSAVQAETFRVKGAGNVQLVQTGKGYGLKSPDGTMWYITVSNAGALSTSTTAP